MQDDLRAMARREERSAGLLHVRRLLAGLVIVIGLLVVAANWLSRDKSPEGEYALQLEEDTRIVLIFSGDGTARWRWTEKGRLLSDFIVRWEIDGSTVRLIPSGGGDIMELTYSRLQDAFLLQDGEFRKVR